jgi:hypothetical protein
MDSSSARTRECGDQYDQHNLPDEAARVTAVITHGVDDSALAAHAENGGEGRLVACTDRSGARSVPLYIHQRIVAGARVCCAV